MSCSRPAELQVVPATRTRAILPPPDRGDRQLVGTGGRALGERRRARTHSSQASVGSPSPSVATTRFVTRHRRARPTRRRAVRAPAHEGLERVRSRSRRRGSSERRRARRQPGPRAAPSPAAGRPRRRRRRPGRTSATSRSTTVSSGSSTTSSSMARPAPRSRMSMPTTSPRTAPMRLATAPAHPAVGQPHADDDGSTWPRTLPRGPYLGVGSVV